jgi:uncharacterized protein YjiS (DUF1127 family)
LENDMAMISSGFGQPAAAATPGLLRAAQRLAQALADYCERRAAIKALSERDDRELRDIGLTRGQIEAAVGGALNPHRGRML